MVIKQNIKNLIKNSQSLWQIVCTCNNCLNLFFRGNNLFQWYLNNIGSWSNIKINGFVKLYGCSFSIGRDENQLIIENKSKCRNVVFRTESNGNEIKLGSNVEINASRSSLSVISACEGTKIQIGDNSLISNGVEIHTTDYHSVIDSKTHKRTNYAKDIFIGNHVWIGLHSIILKGVNIPEGCIVAAGSLVVNKKLEETNSLIAGNPAMIIKRDIDWNIKRL